MLKGQDRALDRGRQLPNGVDQSLNVDLPRNPTSEWEGDSTEESSTIGTPRSKPSRSVSSTVEDTGTRGRVAISVVTVEYVDI